MSHESADTPCAPDEAPRIAASGAAPEAAPAPRYIPPVCGARCRDGHACKAPAMLWKARCRMHGGASTGARTPEGRAKVLACLAAGRAGRRRAAAAPSTTDASSSALVNP